jgi:hypothetical protein
MVVVLIVLFALMVFAALVVLLGLAAVLVPALVVRLGTDSIGETEGGEQCHPGPAKGSQGITSDGWIRQRL